MLDILQRCLLIRLAAAALLLLVAVPLPAQVIEEEDLEEPDLIEELGEPQDDDDLATLFAAAESQLFSRQDAVASLASYNRLLGIFERRRMSGELSAKARRLMVKSLTYRARLHFAFADQAAIDADLGRILELEPSTELAEGSVEPEILERFTKLRTERIGTMRITVDPPDLTLKIDGRTIDLPGAVPEAAEPATEGEAEPPPPPEAVVTLLAGIRLLEAERPGYGPFVQEVEVRPGVETSQEVVLLRSSAVLRLYTRPPGAEVVVDGLVRGTTVGTAPPGSLTLGGRYRTSEFSGEMVISGVEPGLRILEVKLDGYRSYRSELIVDSPDDYDLPPIVLQPQSGTLVLRSFPKDGTIKIDGRGVRPDNPGAPVPEIGLLPGEYRLQVAAGPTRMFATDFSVADRQTVEVTVRLNPGLAFLGVLGGDEGRAADLARSLRLAFRASGSWALLDRGDVGPAILETAGFTAESARLAASSSGAAQLDYRALQRAVDRGAPGLIYAAAVLSDDLLPTHADVWIWAAAPGPARPERVRLTLGRQEEARQLVARFSPSFVLRRPWLGGLVVTSDAVPHPFVAYVTPQGPLEAAGVRTGDQIVAVARVPVFTGADVEARILAAETGETIDLGVQTSEGTRNVRVTLGASPRIYSEPIPGTLEPIAYTELALRLDEQPASIAWVLRLNQALMLLRAGDYEGTVRALRDLRVPQNKNGVGQGTVDYYMGLALANAGGDYRELAIAALDRAAASGGARLGHHDGPWVAPRARARLLALGGGG